MKETLPIERKEEHLNQFYMNKTARSLSNFQSRSAQHILSQKLEWHVCTTAIAYNKYA